MKLRLWAALAVFVLTTGMAQAAPPTFVADTSQVPALQPWGRVAEALCTIWYPRIVTILKANDRVRPLPKTVKIVFEKDMDGVAYVAGTEMHIAAHWVTSHPADFGMVVHELTHLVQRYPSGDAGWLVEGIADYVRARHFEPQVPLPRIDFTRAKVTDAYKTTAAFLIWLEDTYGKGIVPALSNALREGTYTDERFKALTGKELPALWEAFAAASS
jgi:hypothetical protein